MNLAGHVEEFGRTLGEELLEPTRIYAKDCLALAAETQVRTFCHVTGGGLAGNLERVIPHGLVAELDRGTWTPAPVFGMIAQRGRIERAEMEKTFNMGVGMVAVVAPEDTDRALADPDRPAPELLDPRHRQERQQRRPTRQARGSAPTVLKERGGGSAPPVVLVGPRVVGEPVVGPFGFARRPTRPALAGAGRNRSAVSCI